MARRLAKALRQAIPLGAAHGIPRLLVTYAEDHAGSRAVIEANCGVESGRLLPGAPHARGDGKAREQWKGEGRPALPLLPLPRSPLEVELDQHLVDGGVWPWPRSTRGCVTAAEPR